MQACIGHYKKTDITRNTCLCAGTYGHETQKTRHTGKTQPSGEQNIALGRTEPCPRENSALSSVGRKPALPRAAPYHHAATGVQPGASHADASTPIEIYLHQPKGHPMPYKAHPPELWGCAYIVIPRYSLEFLAELLVVFGLMIIM